MNMETMKTNATNAAFKIVIETLGCKVNQAESEHILRQLVAAGYRQAVPDEEPDIYILNTCTVTATADSKTRHRLRAVRRHFPNAFIIATGCYADRAAGELERIPGPDLIIGNADKNRLADIIKERGPNTCSPTMSPVEISGEGGRTRTFLKVQDGCRRFCSYCIVPLVRSREESLAPDKVIREIKLREEQGYREIVLTGVEVGSYHYGGLNIAGLLQKALSETAIPRIRLSSLQPEEINTELVRLWRDSRLCRHFHISLQSGSDFVLRRMNRRYTTKMYEHAISIIRDALPDAAITTDVITGFSGETDGEFEETLRFCEKIKFARIHVFPFSPREGTKAANFPDQIKTGDKQLRTGKMLSLSERCINEFSIRFVGTTLSVLFEKKEGKLWSGLTGNYIRVYTKAAENLLNEIIDVHIDNVFKDGVSGSINSQ